MFLTKFILIFVLFHKTQSTSIYHNADQINDKNNHPLLNFPTYRLSHLEQLGDWHPSYELSAIYGIPNNHSNSSTSPSPTEDELPHHVQFKMNSTIPIINLDNTKGILHINCHSSLHNLDITANYITLQRILNWWDWWSNMDKKHKGKILMMLNPKHECHGVPKVYFKLMNYLYQYNQTTVRMNVEEADLHDFGDAFEFNVIELSNSNSSTTNETAATGHAENGTIPLKNTQTMFSSKQKKFNWTTNITVFPLGREHFSFTCEDCHARGYFQHKLKIKGLFKRKEKASISMDFMGELDTTFALRFELPPQVPIFRFTYNLVTIPIYAIMIPGLFDIGATFKIKQKFKMYAGPRTSFTTGIGLRIPPFHASFHRPHETQLENGTIHFPKENEKFTPQFFKVPFKLHNVGNEIRTSVSILPVFSAGLGLFNMFNLDVGLGVNNQLAASAAHEWSEECHGLHFLADSTSDFVAEFGPAQVIIKRLFSKVFYDRCFADNDDPNIHDDDEEKEDNLDPEISQTETSMDQVMSKSPTPTILTTTIRDESEITSLPDDDDDDDDHFQQQHQFNKIITKRKKAESIRLMP